MTTTDRPARTTHLAASLASVFALALPATAIAQRGAPNLTDDQLHEVERLLDEMTVREKAGQMTQITLEPLSGQDPNHPQNHTLDPAKAREIVVDGAVGSILNNAGQAFEPAYWRQIIGELQRLATEETRLGVPLIYGIDSVHGANYVRGATLFPHNLTLAATFNPELARIAGEITAAESRAAGLTWNFSPVGDVARSPAWSRVFETFGEDPHLAGVMVAANIEGQQGDDLTSPRHMAACAKHFLGYSASRTGRDRTTADVSIHDLIDTFYPPFDMAFDVDVRTIMINSGDISGVPVHADPRILTDLLRHRADYQGVAVTDWEDVLKLRSFHRVAETERDATRLAVEAGIDMAMTPFSVSFADELADLVDDGVIMESRLDESVRRILRLKMELGLFDHPLVPPGQTIEIGSDASYAASLQAAREGVVLLKNDETTLPLENGGRIFVTGPTADDVVPVHGSWTWTWQGTDPNPYPDTPTVLDAIRDRFGAGSVSYQQGATLDENGSVGDLDAVRLGVRNADTVVLCLGEFPSTEMVGNISDLAIPAAQQELAHAVLEAAEDSGARVVLLLIENRPRLVTRIAEQADAVLWAGHPGTAGPEAIAEILAGDVNPSGKLPLTYPRHANALLTYDRRHADDLGPDSQPGGGYLPLYPFGHGLSYTTFEHTGLDVSVPTGFPHLPGSTVDVAVTVRNTGKTAGAETTMLFVTDRVASVAPRVRRLKAFAKNELEPGQSRRVSFKLGREAFDMVDRDGNIVFEPGEFTITVGDMEHTFRLH